MDDDMAHAHDQHDEYEPKPDIPETVDSERSPQLNKTVCRCRHGCQCACSRGDGEGDTDGGGAGLVDDSIMSSAASDAGSDDGASIAGEEGVEDHKIRISGCWVSLRDVYAALARHNDCTCHGRLMPEEYPYTGCNTAAASRWSPKSSTAVELNHDQRSMSAVSLALSAHSLLSRATSASGLVRFSDAQFDLPPAVPTPPPSYVHSPVVLNAERHDCHNLEVGTDYGMHFAPELTMSLTISSGSDHSAYDMW